MRILVTGISFVRCGSFSRLKGEQSRTRTLAACRQAMLGMQIAEKLEVQVSGCLATAQKTNPETYMQIADRLSLHRF